MPLHVLLQHGIADDAYHGVAGWGGVFPEEGFELHRRECLVALVVEVNPIDGQRLGGSGVERLRSMEQVHKGHTVRLGHFSHGTGVEFQILIVG